MFFYYHILLIFFLTLFIVLFLIVLVYYDCRFNWRSLKIDAMDRLDIWQFSNISYFKLCCFELCNNIIQKFFITLSRIVEYSSLKICRLAHLEKDVWYESQILYQIILIFLVSYLVILFLSIILVVMLDVIN